MPSLQNVVDLPAFDDIVGNDIACALARLEAIANELGDNGPQKADSVAAMTRAMALDDEKEALQEAIAQALLGLRRRLPITN